MPRGGFGGRWHTAQFFAISAFTVGGMELDETLVSAAKT